MQRLFANKKYCGSSTVLPMCLFNASTFHDLCRQSNGFVNQYAVWHTHMVHIKQKRCTGICDESYIVNVP